MAQLHNFTENEPLEYVIIWVRKYKNCVIVRTKTEKQKDSFGATKWHEATIKITAMKNPEKTLAKFKRGKKLICLNNCWFFNRNEIKEKVEFT